jgi:hypothetical protein
MADLGYPRTEVCPLADAREDGEAPLHGIA